MIISYCEVAMGRAFEQLVAHPITIPIENAALQTPYLLPYYGLFIIYIMRVENQCLIKTRQNLGTYTYSVGYRYIKSMSSLSLKQLFQIACRYLAQSNYFLACWFRTNPENIAIEQRFYSPESQKTPCVIWRISFK